MKRASAERLATAYTLLRRVEHRIQYLDDQQTHLLPTDDGDLAWIAASLGPPRGRRLRSCSTGSARRASSSPPSSTRCCTTAARQRRQRLPQLRPGAAAGRRRDFLDQLPPELAARVRPLCEQPKIRLLRDESKVRLAGLVARARQAVARRALHAGGGDPLRRLARAAAAARELPRAARRAPRGAEPAAAPARPGALADALPDAAIRASSTSWPTSACCTTASIPPPTRASSRSATPAGSARARPTRSCCSTRCAAPTTPRSSARWCATSRATSRSSRSPTTCRRWPTPTLSLRPALGLGAPEVGAPRRAAARRHRLRQARRQGARLRQRPRRRLRLRRCRDRARQGGRGLRRLRAQADHLADDAHRRRRAVRHRHRAAAERQLGPARHVDRLVRELPDRPRQQHRLDLGAPGPHAGALLRRHRRLAPRFEAMRRAVLAAPRDPAALRGEVTAMREKVRAAHPVRAGRFDLKHSAGGMIDVEFAVQYLVLADERHPSGAARQRRQHRAARPRRGGAGCCPRASAAPRPMPIASCAGPSTGPASTSSRPSSSRRPSRRSAPPCSRSGVPSSAEAASPGDAGRLWIAARRCSASAPSSPSACRRPRSTGSRRSPRASPGAPGRAAFVHLSALHLAANLAGTALVGALGCVAARAAAQRPRLARSPGR